MKNYHTKLKAYSIAVTSLKKQIEAKRKQQLRTKCANKRFLIEEEKQDLKQLVDEINELRRTTINI
jgi:hypothetical protein